jgi:hypothetical protein
MAICFVSCLIASARRTASLTKSVGSRGASSSVSASASRYGKLTLPLMRTGSPLVSTAAYASI